MHIVFISREYPPTLRGGGIASYVRNMAEYYSQSGHQVTVVCASDDTRKESDISIDGIHVIRLSKGDFIIPAIEGNSVRKKFRCLYRFHSYRKRIKETILKLQDVDIIEVPEYGAESYYLHTQKIPVVIRLHNPSCLDMQTLQKKKFQLKKFYSYWTSQQEITALHKAQNITSCSESLKKWSTTHLQICPQKIKVIHNPVNTAFWSYPPKSNENSSLDAFHILYAGTISDKKGVGDLLNACQILRNRNLNVTLSLAGKIGTYGLKLKTEMGTSKWCHFLGNVDRDILKDAYAKCDIACFPSWWESLSLVCIEAMACGCLVIGSKSGGMSEIINHGKDGFLISPHSPEELSECIYQCSILPIEKQIEIRKAAQNKIIQNFDIKQIAKEMLQYYKIIIEKSCNLSKDS